MHPRRLTVSYRTMQQPDHGDDVIGSADDSLATDEAMAAVDAGAPPPVEETQSDVDGPASRDRMEPAIKQMTLADRSLFRGQVNTEDEPHGLGVWYSALGTEKYSGEFQSGMKSGLGISLYPNGRIHAGEHCDGVPRGFGVKTDPFGERSYGRWVEGVLEGNGLVIDVGRGMRFGTFEMGDPIGNDRVTWGEVENNFHRSLCAEQCAVKMQEQAREVESKVMLQQVTSIGKHSFQSSQEIQGFEAQEERGLQDFLANNQANYRDVEDASNKWKFMEAQLKERQKLLRKTIDEKRTELSYISQYCKTAEDRRTQLRDAKETLSMVQRQQEIMQAQLDGLKK